MERKVIGIEEFLLSFDLREKKNKIKKEKWAINFFPNEIPLTQQKTAAFCNLPTLAF